MSEHPSEQPTEHPTEQPAEPASEHPTEPAELEPDPDVPPRPEEAVADAAASTGKDDPEAEREPAAGGRADGEPAQGEGAADSQ